MNKSILIYPLWILSLIILLAGCEKEAPEIPEKPVIKLEVSDSNPEFGGSSTVTWEVIGEYEKMFVRINGKDISTSSKGEKVIQNISRVRFQAANTKVLRTGAPFATTLTRPA